MQRDLNETEGKSELESHSSMRLYAAFENKKAPLHLVLNVPEMHRCVYLRVKIQLICHLHGADRSRKINSKRAMVVHRCATEAPEAWHGRPLRYVGPSAQDKVR